MFVIKFNPKNSLILTLPSLFKDAFATLLTHNLICAPVWDSQQNGYLGFFDINDALSISYDIDLISHATGDALAAKESMRTTAVQVFEIFNKANQIRDPSLDVPWIAVGPFAPMKEVIPVLAKRARRVPVVDPDTGRVVKIISQMDVVRHLYLTAGSQREKDWPEILSNTPLSTGIGMKPVVTITEEQEAREAFRKMIDLNVSCVGIVDDEGKLIGCISNKDIQVVMRGMQKSDKQTRAIAAPMMAQSSKQQRGRFSIAASMTSDRDFFGMPAMMFVSEVRKETEKEGRTHVAACELAPESTFKHIIDKIYLTGHHRIFLVDENHIPVGLVSVADICELICEDIKPKDSANPPATNRVAPPPIPNRKKTGEDS